jgi:hypothetical protein
MSRRAVIHAFKVEVEPELKALGFDGRRGHLVRARGAVTQVIELQYSIYGGRVTANLGLDLTFLKPLVRWIAQPSLGPHAHDSTRWIRIGLVRPERSDHWWSFEPGVEEAAVRAVRELGQAIIEYGVSWLDTECERDAFLHYARARIDRGRCPERPNGTYLDLRLCAAVLAWCGQLEEAQANADLARACWEDERARLVAARAEFQKTKAKTRMPSVPDIQGELEELISTTTASSGSSAAREPSSRRRSRSARL